MATTAPRRPLSAIITVPAVRDVHLPRRLANRPTWLLAAVMLVILLVLSAVIRTRALSAQFWFNEAIATGVASHSIGALPGAVRNAGGAPLYYTLLHFWINALGSSESDARALSLLFGLVSIPVAGWAGWSLGGRRAGLYAAVLLAFSAFLTQYSEQAQPYALMVLLGLVIVTAFVHAFIYRRRGYLWLFAIALEAAFYTQGTAGLLLGGLVGAFAVVVRCAAPADRRAIVLDGALCLAAVVLFYVPWLPTTIHQILHDTSPWHYNPVLGADIPGDMVGGERVDATLLVPIVMALVPLAVVRERRRSPEAVTFWALIVLVLVTIAIAGFASIAAPDWLARYMAPIVAPVLLLGALAAARARVVGFAAVLLVFVFCADPASFATTKTSNMRDVAGQLGRRLHPGDVVALGQPEQAPLAAYYLPAGLRYETTIGPVSDPSTVNWDDAMARLSDARPAAVVGALVASLKPGQQLLFVRPLTEGSRNWNQPWSRLVRRRSAQWGQILTEDVTRGTLTAEGHAPSSYPGDTYPGSSAILFRKTA